MTLPEVAEPLPSSYTFGKVVGRVIHLIADTAEDADDKPQARAAVGKVTFTPREVLRKTTEADYPAIVLHAAESATLSGSGRVLDAEGRQGIWLAVGVYTVSFDIKGAARAIPPFDIQVTAEHDDDNPLDLASAAPYVPPTGVAVQTLVVPQGGTEGQALVRAAGGGLEWATPAGGGVTDHGDLAGLGDDDHPQYLTEGRGDARYVRGTDPRLSDARTPTAHTHPVTELTATGTRDTTTFLRGDGTWATPAVPAGSVTAANITDATTVGRNVLTAADAAAARSAIGAGTSNLALGTTSSTAKAGNWSPPAATATAQGIVELATDAETQTGTDTTRAVTPAGVKAALDARPAGGGLTAGVTLRAIWNGTAYIDRTDNSTITSAADRPAGTYFVFLGGPDPNALGLMVDGDEWKDAAA